MTTATGRLPTIGSLVTVRARDWVVVGLDEPRTVLLRPLTGGTDVTGIYHPLEPVRPAHFDPPSRAPTGDATSVMLLFDAARLSIRSGAAPFRLLSHISVQPRAYQFVPLVMALGLDRARLLIADDVGVGKTIEAGMIMRELIDRGAAGRTVVVCPAHLTGQWASELAEKFGIDARVVQPSTIGRLERELPRADIGLFQYFPHVVVSVDWIKTSDHGRALLNEAAPDLVVVDEAHMCARPPSVGGGRAGRQQRHEYLARLAAVVPHMLLLSATPHSGFDSSFRSLLGLLDPALDSEEAVARHTLYASTEEDGPGAADSELMRRHIVLRRRRDLAHWLGEDTPFPRRDSLVEPYQLGPDYRKLYDDVVRYCRESINQAAGMNRRQQRVRFWAATAILRCVVSSPAAAESVLLKRASRQRTEAGDGEQAEALDELYNAQILDPTDMGEPIDVQPTAAVDEADLELAGAERSRLVALGRRAASLATSRHDVKLRVAARLIAQLLSERYSPIVFCRYIATARYLAAELPAELGRLGRPNVAVGAVTGEQRDDERRDRVADLAAQPVRVLVATDCLSEGINLQDHFDAVLHYDLPWNPNRLDQRDGRVDRFGQPRDVVRTIRLVGDTPIDRLVNERLLEKAIRIRETLGVSLPLIGDVAGANEAIVRSALLSGPAAGGQTALMLESQELADLDQQLDRMAEAQRANEGRFAAPIDQDLVRDELAASENILGDSASVHRFVVNGYPRFNGRLQGTREKGVFELEAGDLGPRLPGTASPCLTFEAVLGAEGRGQLAGRTHPAVETLAGAILGKALARTPSPDFPRAGAIVTEAVERRTAVLLLRLRFLLRDRAESYAEEVLLEAFRASGEEIEWLGEVESLMTAARPAANMTPEEKTRQVRWALEVAGARQTPEGAWDVTGWEARCAPVVERRVGELMDSNNRLRRNSRQAPLVIEPRVPPDILGVCVLVPVRGEPGQQFTAPRSQ